MRRHSRAIESTHARADEPTNRTAGEGAGSAISSWADRAPDVDKAARILPRWFGTNQPEETAVAMGKQFAERQIERLWVVGSNETTGPVIEASYRRLLHRLDTHLTS